MMYGSSVRRRRGSQREVAPEQQQENAGEAEGREHQLPARGPVPALEALRRAQSGFREDDEVKGSFNVLVLAIFLVSVGLAVGSWSAAILGKTDGWIPRCLIALEFVLVNLHFAVTSEEGPFLSVLYKVHSTFVFFFNGVAGLAWWGSTKPELRAGIGWPIFFGVLVFLGLLSTLGDLHDGGRSPAIFRCGIIRCQRGKLGDFAIQRLVAAFGAVIPFQILTIANSVFGCVAAASVTVSLANTLHHITSHQITSTVSSPP